MSIHVTKYKNESLTMATESESERKNLGKDRLGCIDFGAERT